MRTLEEVLARSEPQFKGLNRAVEFAARQLVIRAYQAGVDIRIVFGLRTFAKQQELYNQGRYGNPPPIVTNALPGHSNHNYGLAIDFVLSMSGYDMKADYDKDGLADWMEVVAIAKTLGFEWGGDWKSFVDNPHFEMTFGLKIKDLLAGKRPTKQQEQAVIDKITKLIEGEEEMRENEELKAKVELLENRLAAVEKRVNISGNQVPAKWSHPSLEAAKRAKVITKTNDKSHFDLITIQMLNNIGLLNEDLIGLLKTLDKDKIAKLKEVLG